mmetsp:Transcript_84999/g.173370  ORF Transcript_84999/g.173370 Transcript_84999/m.173370 type:complete len:365 (+) Transcript_84999:409-1503(+)
MGLQVLGQCHGVGGVALHAHVQRLQAPQSHVAVERRRHGTHTVLHETEVSPQLLAASGHEAHDHIAVAVHKLGNTVDHHVGPQLQRALEVRRHEGVVDSQQNVVGLRDGSDLADVRDLQGGVGGGFHPDQLRVRADGALQLAVRADVTEAELDGGVLLHQTLEVALRATVHVVDGHHVAAGFKQVHHGGRGGGARGEGNSVLATLRRRDCLLEGSARGVSGTAVLVTDVVAVGVVLAHDNARRLLGKRGGKADRNCDCAGHGVGLLASVDDARGKVSVGVIVAQRIVIFRLLLLKGLLRAMRDARRTRDSCGCNRFTRCLRGSFCLCGTLACAIRESAGHYCRGGSEGNRRRRGRHGCRKLARC